jgi:hypothetical protein
MRAHPLPALLDEASKSANQRERPTGATTSDLIESLVAALAEARLAMDALTMNLGTGQVKKPASRSNKMKESL